MKETKLRVIANDAKCNTKNKLPASGDALLSKEALVFRSLAEADAVHACVYRKDAT